MGSMIDLTGQRFGRLTVIKRDQTSYGKGPVRWICVCDCGNVKSVVSPSLRRGATQSCGCLNREIITGKSNAHDLTEKRFGRLIVVGRAENYITPSGQVKCVWNCKCDCGNMTSVFSQSLKEGHTKSCGCLPTKKRGDGLIDLTGERFSNLLVIRREDDYISPKGAPSPSWLCQCNCGNEIIVQGGNLRGGVVKHCGCEGVLSKGEEVVNNFLIENDVRFLREYSFSDLRNKNGNLLRFDFAILNDAREVVALIEYQGEQHYIDCGEFGLYQRKYSDPIKQEYCERRNLPLYKIKFDADIEDSCKILLEELIDHKLIQCQAS